MKNHIQFVLFILIFTSSFGQTEQVFVPIISYWKDGDSYDYHVTKIKRKMTDGNITRDDSVTYTANFKVINAKESGYTIEWQYKTDLMGLGISEELTKKYSKYAQTKVIYETDDVGAFKQVLNWKEISQMMDAIVSEFISSTYKDKKEQEQMYKTISPLLSVYGSKEGIEQIALKELQYFHFPMGYEFSVTDTLEYQDLLPNLLGGDPIHGDARIFVKHVDFDSTCSLSHEMKLNPEDTKNMIYLFCQKMNLDEKAMKQAIDDAVFEINDTNSYEFLFSPGIPSKLETKRETIINLLNENVIQHEIIRLELIR